ncbi:MAG TPA: aldo/keto reductase [Gemmatimonadaceae bacterium]|nr:aldo/keto reductase [Gemmatimonadaceae bacterium]
MPAQLGLGLAALGRPGYVTLNHARDLGEDYNPDAMESHAHSVLDAAYKAGVRYVDAARSYGKAEDFVASWLKRRQLDRTQITIASKWGYTYTAGWSTSAAQHEIKDHSLATFTRQLEETLQRLDGFVSIYQIHSVTAESKTLDDDALIDAIALLKEEKGIAAGLTVSGAGQAAAIRKSVEVERDGVRVFDTVQATWNLLERGAESALSDAYDAGMTVIIKEALANGRLVHGNEAVTAALGPALSEIRKLADNRGVMIDTLALSAALNRPWANYVLSGAATIGQIVANAAARELTYDADLDAELREFSVGSDDYWRARSGFKWN